MRMVVISKRVIFPRAEPNSTVEEYRAAWREPARVEFDLEPNWVNPQVVVLSTPDDGSMAHLVFVELDADEMNDARLRAYRGASA